MATRAADDSETISRRLAELKAERDAAWNTPESKPAAPLSQEATRAAQAADPKAAFVVAPLKREQLGTAEDLIELFLRMAWASGDPWILPPLREDRAA